MDLPIYLGLGLLAGGYMLNGNGKQARKGFSLDQKRRQDQLENKKAGNNNIYDTGYFKKVREMEDERVIKNFEKSFDPINTSIIPFYFNTLSETNKKRVKNANFDKDLFQRELTKYMKTTPLALTRLEAVPNDLTVVNQDASVESGGFQGDPPRGLFADTTLNKNWGEIISRPEGDRGLNNRESFDMPMTHNNMVPFFGGTIKQNMEIENRMTADKLENFTGQFKLKKQHKTESGVLFAPVQQNLEQLTAPRELDRFTTSLQVRNNELPFEQIKVGHGLNDGYTARPSGGFHNPLRILPKNIDQLLVNPRVVAEGRVIRGKDTIDKRTAEQQQYKYRPELLVTNLNGERNFTTTGAWLKPKVRSKQVIRATNRNKSRKVIGGAHDASGSKLRSSQAQPFGKMSLKRNFKNTEFRNAVLGEGKNPILDAHLSYQNIPNERSSTQTKYGQKGYNFYNRKSTVTQGQTYTQDKAKTTRQQAYIHNKNPSGFAQPMTKKSKVYDPNQVTKTTIRQQTEINSHKGGATLTTKGKVYDQDHTAKTTVREGTENNQYQGTLQSSRKQGKAYDMVAHQPRTTIREGTSHNHQGAVVLAPKGQVYDNIAYQPRTTQREMDENNHSTGQITSGFRQGQTYDPNQVARTTHRETQESNHHSGQLQGESKGQVYDPFDHFKPTHRETQESNHHQGQVQNQSHRGIVYDPSQGARTTLKEGLEVNSHIGQIQGQNQKGPVMTDPMRTTTRETIEQQNHQGQFQSGVVKTKLYNPDEVARTTHRETTQPQSHQGQLQSGVKRGQVYNDQGTKTTHRETMEQQSHTGQIQTNVKRAQNYNDQATKTTHRETTEQGNHLGSSTFAHKPYVYDPTQVAKTTTKEQTERTDRFGGSGQAPKTYIYDPNQVAKTTIKEQTEQNDQIGGAYTNSKSKVYDPQDVAKTTIREATELTENLGIATSENSKGIVYDPFDFAKDTYRQFTEDNKYMGQVDAIGVQSGDGYLTAPTDVKNTSRQFLTDYYYVKPAQVAEGPANPMDQEAAYNMRQDVNKEVVSEGRYPTLSNVKLFNGQESTNIEIKKLDQDRLNQYSSAPGPTLPNHRTPANPCEMTSYKNNLGPQNMNFDPSLLSAFKSNPLTQSLNSWA